MLLALDDATWSGLSKVFVCIYIGLLILKSDICNVPYRPSLILTFDREQGGLAFNIWFEPCDAAPNNISYQLAVALNIGVSDLMITGTNVA